MAAIGGLQTGSGVDYYTRGMQREHTSYYTGATHQSEPPGTWSGAGAAKLGLTGQVTAEAMENLYTHGKDPRDPSGRTFFGPKPRNYKAYEEIVAEKLAREPDALPERIREIELEAKRACRTSNVFIDFTYSLSKDLTVQHTAAGYAEQRALAEGRTDDAARYQHVRETIERAGDAGNRAALDYLNQHAGYARTGRHGKGQSGRWIEAKEWTVATFFQHTSRAGDPQMHWHNPVLLNTECADGKIRKLHTTLFYDQVEGAAATGARVTQEIITAELGWTFELRTDGNGHELTNVDQKVKDLFSDRRGAVVGRAEELVEEFVAAYGREPTTLELGRLRQQATLETRPGKPKAGQEETRLQQFERWDAKLRATLGAGLARQAASAAGVHDTILPDDFSPSATMKRAVARVQESSSTWNRADLTRAMEAELPPYLGVGPERVPVLIEGLVEATLQSDLVQQITGRQPTSAVPRAFTLANGQSAYLQPGSVRYASRDHVASEQALQRAAIVRGRMCVSEQAVDRWLAEHAGMGLRPDQAAALKGVLTGGAAIDTLIGPAGAGKTYVLGAISQAWRDLVPGGRVIGLATSEQATEVMRGENIEAKNIAQWLGANRRAARHGQVQGLSHTSKRVATASDDDRYWQVRPTDIIIPDEASMADQSALREIHDYVEAAGAKMLPAGDTGQLPAVGQGGAMALIAGTEGAAVYELTEVARFQNTWEGPASLKFRAGETAVLDEYEMHDRIRDGGTPDEAQELSAEMYVGDRLAGKSSLVVAPTNKMAAEVNGIVRQKLVEHGRVDEHGMVLERDGNVAGVGDLVRCRQNNWAPGLMLRNQGRYMVTKVDVETGAFGIRDVDTGREIDVPAAYRAEFVELGYATTIHGAQGATVGTGIPIIQEGMTREAAYPALTRGRERNTAVVITKPVKETPGGPQERDHRDAKAILADILEAENEGAKAALTRLREDIDRAGSLRTVADMYEEAMREFGRERTGHWLDKLAAEVAITEADRMRLAADQGTEQLGRLLRTLEQAGHDPEQALRAAVASRSLEGARSPAQVLHHRLSQDFKGRMTPVPEQAVLPPADAPAEYQEHFDELADRIREKRLELGAKVAEDQPTWAVETLGPVPDDMLARAEWEHRAGVVAAHREASDWTDETEPLPPPPGTSKTEARARWHEAWQAAGRPSTTAEEHELSEGALRIRVAAMQRENAALPPSVHETMQATERELYAHQHEVAKLGAELDRVADEQRTEQLRAELAEKEAMIVRLEAKRDDLQAVADERVRAMEESAVTRDLGERAQAELAARGVAVDNEPDRVTAEEWLALEAQSRVEDDAHREVTEDDAPSEGYAPELDELVQVPDTVEFVEVELVDAVTDAEIVEGVEESEAVMPPADALPEGVPSDLEVDAAVVAAKVAAERLADRASEEATLRASEQAAAAQAEQDALEAYDRQQAHAEIERASRAMSVDAAW